MVGIQIPSVLLWVKCETCLEVKSFLALIAEFAVSRERLYIRRRLRILRGLIVDGGILRGLILGGESQPRWILRGGIRRSLVLGGENLLGLSLNR